MRYGYMGLHERQGLCVKRAFAVAFFYTGTMAGCALAIVLCADHLARQAAPMLMPPVSSPALAHQHAAAASLHKPGASNAAIIASIEARQASTKSGAARAAVARPAKSQTVASAPGRNL